MVTVLTTVSSSFGQYSQLLRRKVFFSLIFNLRSSILYVKTITIRRREIMMQKGEKLLIGITIVVGVICIELSMYVIPFIEEVTEFEFPMFVVGVILCIIFIIFGIRHQKS